MKYEWFTTLILRSRVRNRKDTKYAKSEGEKRKRDVHLPIRIKLVEYEYSATLILMGSCSAGILPADFLQQGARRSHYIFFPSELMGQGTKEREEKSKLQFLTLSLIRRGCRRRVRFGKYLNSQVS